MEAESSSGRNVCPKDAMQCLLKPLHPILGFRGVYEVWVSRFKVYGDLDTVRSGVEGSCFRAYLNSLGNGIVSTAHPAAAAQSFGTSPLPRLVQEPRQTRVFPKCLDLVGDCGARECPLLAMSGFGYWRSDIEKASRRLECSNSTRALGGWVEEDGFPCVTDTTCMHERLLQFPPLQPLNS